MILFLVHIFLVIVVFLLILSFLVIIHELGHYLTARFFKVRVEEFGLGYPPKAKELFTHQGTVFSLNWVPFGGFVRMEGEEGEKEEDKHKTAESKESRSTKLTKKNKTQREQTLMSDDTQVGPFYEKSRLARMVIILAGATVNFLCGIVIFSLVFSIHGIPILESNPRVGMVEPNSPAAQAHLPINVDIKAVKVDGQVITTVTPDDVVAAITSHLGQKVTLVTTGPCQEEKCAPQTQEFTVQLRKKEDIPANQGALGIRFAEVIGSKFYPWYQMPFQGAWYGLNESVHLTFFILDILKQVVVGLFHGRVSNDVSGPVGIVYQLNKTDILSQGIWQILEFVAMLSINLAIMNVLPIPALDGGRAFFILIESVVGREKIKQIESSANSVGFVILVALMILITFKDILNIVFDVFKKG